MRISQAFTVLAAIVFPAPIGASSTPLGLEGEYRYELSLGRTVGGTGMVVTYRLSLGLFAAKGYQTDERFRCDARPEGTSLRVSFRSYEDGSVTDQRGNAVYQPGDPLFALERWGTTLITRWMGYPLADDAPHPPGVYLHR